MAIYTGESYWVAKTAFQIGLSAIYAVAFTVAYTQYTGLVGEKGILPVRNREDSSIWDSLSIFYIFPHDSMMRLCAVLGLILSVLSIPLILGLLGSKGYIIIMASMWLLYVSFVNTGEKFYGFGKLLAEAGFLALFLGPPSAKVNSTIVLLMRWLLFRLMLGSGIAKLKEGEVWEKFYSSKLPVRDTALS